MTKYLILLILPFLVACGSDHDVNVDDSRHDGIVYISVAETWREICVDRFNEYDYPDEAQRERERAECRRKFASGEEELDIPEIPGLEIIDVPSEDETE